MTATWDELLPRLREITDLASAAKLMEYDQAVSMPPAGARARSRAVATIEGLLHDRVTDPKLGDLIARLEDDDSLDRVQKATTRILRRDYDRSTKVPKELVTELAELTGNAYQAWTEARPANDFGILQPFLERMFELKRQEAEAVGYEGERYDALLDQFEPDMTSVEVEAMFDELLDGLRPLSEAILNAAGEKPEWVNGHYDAANQEAFSQWLVEQLNFDKSRGRLDLSPHPFTMPIGAGDIRQTTKINEREFTMSIYAAIHETGHALYEQGIPEELLDLPAGRISSLGMHESQSRLWENQVGRSRPFSEWMLPKLKERFPDELGMVSPDEFHRGVNFPERTLIRVTADEVTYNFHVVLRFQLELAIFREELTVADLPDAWDEGMEKFLSIRPDSRSDGILQDMHWSIGAIGYFPTYTLGTLYAAAFYQKAEAELGGLHDEVRRGETRRLLEWLRENIHKEAYIQPTKDLAQSVLGELLTARPFLDYLEAKYSDIYDLKG